MAAQSDPKGYVIIAHKGSNNILPIQACLYLGRETIQHVHNIIIAEEGAELHIISGCTSGGHVGQGAAHYGVSEFYIKKNAKISFTMIHTWTENIEVFPRSASIVEENGVFLSNYVCMQPVKKVQMYPTATLKGENSVARFSTITIASPTSYIDTGSRAILEGKGSSAELITRAITSGGTIISRGQIIGKTAGTRGHLECKGLILKDGIIYAIPEIEGRVVGTELSHEAAVGKLAQEEIEYLMCPRALRGRSDRNDYPGFPRCQDRWPSRGTPEADRCHHRRGREGRILGSLAGHVSPHTRDRTNVAGWWISRSRHGASATPEFSQRWGRCPATCLSRHPMIGMRMRTHPSPSATDRQSPSPISWRS